MAKLKRRPPFKKRVFRQENLKLKEVDTAVKKAQIEREAIIKTTRTAAKSDTLSEAQNLELKRTFKDLEAAYSTKKDTYSASPDSRRLAIHKVVYPDLYPGEDYKRYATIGTKKYIKGESDISGKEFRKQKKEGTITRIKSRKPPKRNKTL